MAAAGPCHSHLVVVPAQAGLAGYRSGEPLSEEAAPHLQWHRPLEANRRGLCTWRGARGCGRASTCGAASYPRAGGVLTSRARLPRGLGGRGWPLSRGLYEKLSVGGSAWQLQVSVEQSGNVSRHAGILPGHEVHRLGGRRLMGGMGRVGHREDLGQSGQLPLW